MRDPDPAGDLLVSTRLPKTYEASAVLQLQAVGGGQSLPGVGDLSGGSGDTQTSDRVAALIATNGVRTKPHGSFTSRWGPFAASQLSQSGHRIHHHHRPRVHPEPCGEDRQRIRDAVRVTRAQQGLARVNDAIATTQAQLKKQGRAANTELVQQLQGLLATRDLR